MIVLTQRSLALRCPLCGRLENHTISFFDFDWRWCKNAKDHGVLIAINPDAHSSGEIALINNGVKVARKGWLEAKDVLNTKNQSEIISFFSERKVKRDKRLN